MILSLWPAANWPAVILSALVLACAMRERGQGHDWLGTTGARLLFWALPVGAVAYALSPNDGPWPAVLAGALAFTGMVLVPHGAGQNLAVPWGGPVFDGLNGINRAERLGYLLTAGTMRLLLISLPMIPNHPAAMWLPLAGVVMPLGYLLGLVMPTLPWRLTRATEWGEWLTGLGFGAALAAALTAG